TGIVDIPDLQEGELAAPTRSPLTIQARSLVCRSPAETTADLIVPPIHSKQICVPRPTNGYLDNGHSYSALRAMAVCSRSRSVAGSWDVVRLGWGIRLARAGDLPDFQLIDRHAGQMFGEVGMPEIAGSCGLSRRSLPAWMRADCG